MIEDSFMLAVKNLRHRGIRSWLTLLGIFIGVLAVVSLISLGNGLKLAVNSQFGVSSTELITVEAGGVDFGAPGSGAVTPLTIKDAEAIQKLGSVKLAVHRYIPSGRAEYNDKVIFGYIASVPDGRARTFVYDQINGEAIQGRLLRDGDTKSVFLGYNFYSDKVGFDKEVTPGKTILIQEEKFKVIGILEQKGSFIYDNAVFMNDKDIEDLFDYEENVDTIEVQPVSKEDIDRAKTDIENLLRKRRDVKVGQEDFSVSTPEASLATINSILTGIQIFIVIIASISIFIGAIGIVNTMTTSVLERRKEIGIMKAIGAKNEHIFLQFFMEAGLLGFIGGAVGVLLGTLAGYLGTIAIGSIIGSQISPSIPLALIFFTLIGSFFIGSLAGILPAMRAAQQNPIDALRG